jgi:hypothetical protein
MAILRAIVAGERSPAVLAQYRDARCACTLQELEAALTGHYLPHQIVALKQALERYDQFGKQVDELDGLIEDILRNLIPLDDEALDADIAAHPEPTSTGKHTPMFAVTRLVELVQGQDATVLDGIGPVSALGLLGLLGRDFSKWKTEKHFTSHLTLAPVAKISGGKLISSRTHPGTHPAAVIFKQAAAAVTRTDTALGAFYRRLAVKIGRGKALTATARKIAVQYYFLMKEGRAYVDIGAHADEERYRRKQIALLTKRAAKLGLSVSAAA